MWVTLNILMKFFSHTAVVTVAVVWCRMILNGRKSAAVEKEEVARYPVQVDPNWLKEIQA